MGSSDVAMRLRRANAATTPTSDDAISTYQNQSTTRSTPVRWAVNHASARLPSGSTLWRYSGQ